MNEVKAPDTAIAEQDLPAIKANIEQLGRLEAKMRELETEYPAEIEIVHHFAPGVYCREMRVPAGVTLTGKIHRHAHYNVLSKGEVTIAMESGPMRVSAGFAFVSAPGTKRAFFVHEDAVWTTVHPNPTDERDLEKLEREIIAEDFADLVGRPALEGE